MTNDFPSGSQPTASSSLCSNMACMSFSGNDLTLDDDGDDFRTVLVKRLDVFARSLGRKVLAPSTFPSNFTGRTSGEFVAEMAGDESRG